MKCIQVLQHSIISNTWYNSAASYHVVIGNCAAMCFRHKQAKHGGGVVCDICGKQLATQVCLKQHIRTIHKRQGLSLKCKYCDERFHCPSAKNTHTYLVHFPDK